MFGQSETSSTVRNGIILGLMMSGCRVGDSGSHVGGPFSFFCGVFEVHHILKITAKHGLNNFSLQLFIGIKNVYLSAAFKSLSIDPTDSLFNTPYSGLIHTFTEATFAEFLPKAHLSRVSRFRMALHHGSTACPMPAHLRTGAQFNVNGLSNSIN